jgi:hypothetical protein
MKVFLSWSGEMSRRVAQVFHDWIPLVIQNVKPFISAGDIDKGQRWSDVLTDRLGGAEYGIIFVTKFNINSRWLHFEAGALGRTVDKSCVSPFLFRVKPSLIEGPLEQFQVTIDTKDDIFNLLRSINTHLSPEQQVALSILQREFECWFGVLNAELNKIEDVNDLDTVTGFQWLYTGEDLKRRQAGILCKEIWLITPNLHPRKLDPRVNNILRRHLTNGVNYTFVVPLSSNVGMSQNELDKLSSDIKPGQLRIAPVRDKAFRELAVTDYIIMNPEPDEKYPLYVFLELPIPQPRYWIEVDFDAASGFAARFRKVAKARQIKA